MKISCQACGTKYTIADDKVRGRKVRVRCKSCSTPIVVDTAQAAAEAEAEAAAATAGAPGDTGAAGDSGDPWTVNLSDTEQRAMTTEEIVTGYHSGTVTEDAFVWKEGMDDWIPLLEKPELRAAIEAYGGAPAAPAEAQPVAPAAPAFPAPPADPSPFAAEPPWASPAAAAAAPAPTPAAPAASARLAGGRSHGATDLFGSVASAGSEEEALRTASLPGSTAYDAKVTGARNENSVLFSLDSLKAGFTAPNPKQPSPKAGAPPPKRPGRPGMQSAPDDPFGMSSGNSGMARLGGGGNPLFSMGDNQALLMAPPPPPEPPPPPVVTDPVGVEYAPAPAAKKGPDKRIMIFGGAAALVLVLGIGIAVAMSGGKKEDEVAEADTKTEKSEKESDKAEKKTEETKAEKAEAKEESKTESEPAATAPSASAAEKKPPTEEEKKRFAEAQKKEQEKKEADKAPEKKELPVPTDGPQFNKGAAIAALSSAASASTSCKRPGGPTGSGKVLVTFAPSGRVTSANVAGGAFGGTSVGGCVASVFRRAKVPPFGGGPVTVSKSFSIKP